MNYKKFLGFILAWLAGWLSAQLWWLEAVSAVIIAQIWMALILID